MDWVLDREFEASDGSSPFILLLLFRIWEIQQTGTDRTFPPRCLEALDKIGEDFKHTDLSSEHVESLLAYIRRRAEAAKASGASQPEENKKEMDLQETTHQDIGVSLEDTTLLEDQRRGSSDQTNESDKENKEERMPQKTDRGIRTPSEFSPLLGESPKRESITQKKQSEGNCRLM